MPYILLILFLLLLLLGPNLWAQHVIEKHSADQPHIPGTGAELAQHLITKFELTGVEVELTEQGSHYDPIAKRIRLQSFVHDGRSLSAVAIAVHELGHAVQDASQYSMLHTRTRLVSVAAIAEKIGSGAFLLAPLAGLLLRTPAPPMLMLVIAVLSMSVLSLVHLVTLPVELDASFKKAMPILEQGDYVSKRDLNIIKKILTAAALTYLAGSMTSMFNLWRWLRLIRR
ncbi:MAG: zinc metallopeptidase [Pseudomonadales bacterium]|nr:zinc metallopeptidase [Pseudomonadales bacterium]